MERGTIAATRLAPIAHMVSIRLGKNNASLSRRTQNKARSLRLLVIRTLRVFRAFLHSHLRQFKSAEADSRQEDDQP